MGADKFTAGPWVRTGFAGLKIRAGCLDVAAVALLPVPGGYAAGGESLANADLIKAAPDLLAALRQCYSDLQRYAPNSAGSIAARAAMAAAEGRA
jgi:hypothetical protein